MPKFHIDDVYLVQSLTMCKFHVDNVYNIMSNHCLLPGFLTGVQQNHARKLGISVDSLVFNFHVKTKPTDTEESLSDLKHKPSVKTSAFKVKGVLDLLLFILLHSQLLSWSCLSHSKNVHTHLEHFQDIF